MSTDRLFNPVQASAYLRTRGRVLSARTIRSMVAAGTMPGRKIAGAYLITEAELRTFVGLGELVIPADQAPAVPNVTPLFHKRGERKEA